ncbi:MAG: c-type cytochrome biogenesis protein CcsB, partial [Gammaproteobacteria bacterium]|nr:c-type cytochrome biogenesis protein CcsB [Gammaproteobacteria bacterium]
MSVPQDVMQGYERPAWYQRLSVRDWGWAVLVLAATIYAYVTYSSVMDGYEIGILAGTGISMVLMGWYWRAFQPYSVAVGVISVLAISIYGNDLQLAEQSFFLKYILSSQSAIMWMSALFVLATVTYFGALFSGNEFTGRVASSMTWSASVMGLVGLMVRWRESYLI